MAKIVISENVSLDGVIQDPTGEEGFARGGWFLEVEDDDREQWAEVKLDEARNAQALLLGRRTDQFFGSRWPSRTGEFADRLNGMPKYVVSATLIDSVWGNATILDGDVVPTISRLKGQLDGDILVYASRGLVHTLIEHELADELRLMIYPVLLGAGDRLFDKTSQKTPMRLLNTRAIGTSLVHLTYSIGRRPVSGHPGAECGSGGPLRQQSLGRLRLRSENSADICRHTSNGSDGTRTRDLRRDRPAL